MKISNLPKIDRPWGFYDLFLDNIEGRMTAKLLHMMPGEILSLSYHFKKDQVYVILDDGFEIQYSRERAIVPGHFEEFLNDNLVIDHGNSGDVFLFRKNIIHRAHYKGNRMFGRLLDISLGDSSDDDIIRIIDKYNRL